MSCRNGKTLAEAMLKRFKEAKAAQPNRPEWECWGPLLDERPGWARVNPKTYQFRTGERLDLSKGSSSDWISQMTAIEVKPMGQGMPPEVQRELIEGAATTAQGLWNLKAFQDD